MSYGCIQLHLLSYVAKNTCYFYLLCVLRNGNIVHMVKQILVRQGLGPVRLGMVGGAWLGRAWQGSLILEHRDYGISRFDVFYSRDFSTAHA